MLSKFRSYLRDLWRRFRYGEKYGCPSCRLQTHWRVEQVSVVFDDEPPILWQAVCLSCGHKTEPWPSALAEKAVRNLGYRDFDHYLEANGPDNRTD